MAVAAMDKGLTGLFNIQTLPHQLAPSSMANQSMYRSNLISSQSNPQSPLPPATPSYPQSNVRTSPHASNQPLPSQIHSQQQSAYSHPGSSAGIQSSSDVNYYPPAFTPVQSTGSFSSAGMFNSEHGRAAEIADSVLIEPPDMMSSAVSMGRQALPSMYATPQSNSPNSVTSPGHDNRAIYHQQSLAMPQAVQSSYGYPHSFVPMTQTNQPAYAHPQPLGQYNYPTQPILGSQSAGLGSYPSHPNHHLQNLASPRSKFTYSNVSTAGYRPTSSSMQPPVVTPNTPHQVHGSSGLVNNATSNSAAPGPIPATTPMVVKQDSNGVQWISFEYSRDRVKHDYQIRCDVEHVNIQGLAPEFKSENCVYPRACVPASEYKGNRYAYESDCNAVGWALSSLNEILRGKRGLIQRAVDSWRNSSGDQKLRSRRVRRQNKMKTRNNAAAQQQQAHHLASHSNVNIPVHNGLPSATIKSESEPQLHHHHNAPTPAIPEPLGPPAEIKSRLVCGNDGRTAVDSLALESPSFNDLPRITQAHVQHQLDEASGMPSPAESRPRSVYHDFPSSYPLSSISQTTVPNIHNAVDHMGPGPVSTAAAASRSLSASPGKGVRKASYSDDILEDPRRKFILVDDTQKNSRVRVRVLLDLVDAREIPDSYRRSNAVYPRAYFPNQTQAPRATPRVIFHGDVSEVEQNSDEAGQNQTLIRMPVIDGGDECAGPALRRRQRQKELLLNDLGYKMSWSQSRVFTGRSMFLQKSRKSTACLHWSRSANGGHIADRSSCPYS